MVSLIPKTNAPKIIGRFAVIVTGDKKTPLANASVTAKTAN